MDRTRCTVSVSTAEGSEFQLLIINKCHDRTLGEFLRAANNLGARRDKATSPTALAEQRGLVVSKGSMVIAFRVPHEQATAFHCLVEATCEENGFRLVPAKTRQW